MLHLRIKCTHTRAANTCAQIRGAHPASHSELVCAVRRSQRAEADKRNTEAHLSAEKWAGGTPRSHLLPLSSCSACPSHIFIPLFLEHKIQFESLRYIYTTQIIRLYVLILNVQIVYVKY